MTNPDQPFFRFHPRAYEIGRTFDRANDPCDVCARACVGRYTGVIYTVREHEAVVCARCIADGRLATFLQEPYCTLHDVVVLDGVAGSLAAELLQRTPRVSCFNPYPWPVLDGMPLPFIGYSDDRALVERVEVREAVADAFAELDLPDDQPTPYALVFREVGGDRWRAAVDLD